MHILEAIIDANHRALAGDSQAGIHPADFRNELPIIALTCIDPRLNRFFPGILGLPEDDFIWQRNAGNIITGSMSSTMRSLALACAIRQGREIAIIGHTDCLVRLASISTLIDRFKALGVERSQLPENLTECFGVFASERQNVMQAVELVRSCPLIGPKIPVHGLMVDIASGKLEWVVNGYETLERSVTHAPAGMQKNFSELASAIGNFNIGEMKFPEGKIGEVATGLKEHIPTAAEVITAAKLALQKPGLSVGAEPPPIAPPAPPKIRKSTNWR